MWFVDDKKSKLLTMASFTNFLHENKADYFWVTTKLGLEHIAAFSSSFRFQIWLGVMKWQDN